MKILRKELCTYEEYTELTIDDAIVEEINGYMAMDDMGNKIPTITKQDIFEAFGDTTGNERLETPYSFRFYSRITFKDIILDAVDNVIHEYGIRRNESEFIEVVDVRDSITVSEEERAEYIKP